MEPKFTLDTDAIRNKPETRKEGIDMNANLDNGDTILVAVGADGVVIPLEGPDAQKYINRETCLYCGVKITTENDSGWQGFCENGGSQSICKACEVTPNLESQCMAIVKDISSTIHHMEQHGGRDFAIAHIMNVAEVAATLFPKEE